MSQLEGNSITKYSNNNLSVGSQLNLKSYTTTQRDALTAVAGDTIYNTTTSKVEYYTGSAWVQSGDAKVKTRLALEEMGVSITSGAMTTFFACCALYLCSFLWFKIIYSATFRFRCNLSFYCISSRIRYSRSFLRLYLHLFDKFISSCFRPKLSIY